MTTKQEKRYGVHHPVKLGTGPREMFWVRIPDGGFDVGKKVVIRKELHGQWTEARIWKMLPPPDYMLFLEY
jgi:hypothetical protein